MAGAPGLSLALLVVAAVGPVVSAPAMRAETDKLLAAEGALRRIPPRGALERRLVTRAEGEAARDEAIAASAGAAELATRARLWQRLGIGVEEGGRALDAAPTASYDAVSHRLSVPDWIPLADQRTTLAHALAHALADQRFGLRDTLRLGLDGRHALDSDAERARLALVEGDATTTALELLDPRGAFGGGHAMEALAARLRAAPEGVAAAGPAWSRAAATFAHADGLLFVGRVRARASWTAVDALWSDPPRSSEQVLHPEKYDRHEDPVPVTLPKLRAVGDAWREVGSDVLGELGVRTWLEATAPEGVAARAAAGWGGDRAALYVSTAPIGADAGPPADAFVAWLTTWDDVTDAEDFALAASGALARLGGQAEAPPSDADLVILRGEGGVFALARRGNVVALLVGAPESALPALDELLGPARPVPKAVTGRKGAKPPAR